jgi:hypothetical protein
LFPLWPGAARGSGPAPDAVRATHIVVIALENHEYRSIIGSPAAPYLNALARKYVLLTGYDAITHPSLPNYLALTAGATFGLRSDCLRCMIRGRTIVDQLELAGVSWKAYMDSMPRACYWGDAYPYVQKHDPFIHYTNVKNDPFRCAKVVPFTQLAADEARNALPGFAFITPNMCHDMHDCSVATGDAWLAGVVPGILAHLGTNGVVVITFDEGTTRAGCCYYAAGGRVATIIAGPGARLGSRLGRAADHYSLLRLIEDNWGLVRLRHAGCGCTPTISGWQA